MKKLLLLLMILISTPFFGQTYQTWRTEATNNNWQTNNNWWNFPNGSPIVFGQQEWDNNHQLSQSSTADVNTWRFLFKGGASSTHTFSGNRIRFFDFGGQNPTITNESSVNHIINNNIEGDGDIGDPLEINLTNGDLTFNGTINNQGSWIDVYGTSSKNLTIAGAISGSGGFALKQNSTVTLTSASNSYSGATSVDAGTLSVQKGGHTASITSSAIAFTFASTTQAAGTYNFLPGQLAGSTSRTLTSNLVAGKTITFNYTTGSVTICDNVGTPSTPTPSASTICQGSANTTYTTSATNAASYTWSVTGAGNSISGTSTTGTVTWAPGFTGSATVSVIANGCNGPSASASTTVTVTSTVGIPSTPSPSATTICQASSPTAYTTSATNATSYTWSVTGAGNSISGTSTTGTVTWAPGFTGSATVSVVANGCNGPSASASTTVTVNPNVTYYQDLDADGFGNPSATQLSCTGVPPGYVANNSDCNDGITYYTDSDGDGFGVLPKLACGTVTNNTDCNDNQAQYQDLDGDGFGNLAVLVACGVTNSADCNDNQLQYQDADGDSFGNAAVLVGCGVANNTDCNDNQAQYQDLDGDGFGNLAVLVACGVTNNTDCNDNQLQYQDADGDSFGNPAVLVGCGVANNADCNDNQAQYQDLDGDGFGNLAVLVACGVTNNADCNDNQLQYQDADGDSFGNPAVLVGCGVANNADCNDNQAQYQDLDGDGFGNASVLVACGVTNSADCNDNQLQYQDADGDSFGNPAVLVGCGVANNSDCNDNQAQYQDLDGDGFGNAAVLVACGVTNSGDCNDNQLQYQDADGDSFGNPAVLVGCGVANNSDCNDNQAQYQDLDGDGFGNAAVLVACGVTNSGDCNDNQLQYQDADGDSFGNPAVLVGCGVANNSDCNDNQAQYQDLDNDGFGNPFVLVACGVTNSSDCNDTITYYTDSDGDGFGRLPKLACGSVTNGTDCNDADILTWRNGVFYVDVDGDNYSPTPATTQTLCYGAAEPVGYSLAVNAQVDCNDNNAAIKPGATEVCYNNVNDNCNTTGTLLSEGCAGVPVNMTSTTFSITSFANAVAALPYTYTANGLPNNDLKYRFTIVRVANGSAPQVTELIPAQSSRSFVIPVSMRLYNAVYKIRAAAVINGEDVPYSGNEMTATGPSVQLITLSGCNPSGTLLTSLTSTIAANSGFNATGYTFRIRLESGTQTYESSPAGGSRSMSANSFAGFPLQYNTRYMVAVQYTFVDLVTGLSVQSGYGSECLLITPSIPTTRITAPVCGSQVTSMGATVTAAFATSATFYQFRIRKIGETTYSQTAEMTSRSTNLGAFGISLLFNTDYYISVRYRVGPNVTDLSDWGAECQFKTPFFPITRITNCVASPGTISLTTQLNVSPYPGAQYVVKFVESTPTIEDPEAITETFTTITTPFFRLSNLNVPSNGPIQLGKSYFVSVAVKLGTDVGNFDEVCDIRTTPPSKTATPVSFKATAYPNPFADNFMLDVKTTSQSVVNVKVYDMVGRLIEQREVRTGDLETTTIGNNYPSGVYNVVVAQEENVETVRVVKR